MGSGPSTQNAIIATQTPRRPKSSSQLQSFVREIVLSRYIYYNQEQKYV
jgi:hypothetical protein